MDKYERESISEVLGVCKRGAALEALEGVPMLPEPITTVAKHQVCEDGLQFSVTVVTIKACTGPAPKTVPMSKSQPQEKQKQESAPWRQQPQPSASFVKGNGHWGPTNGGTKPYSHPNYRERERIERGNNGKFIANLRPPRNPTFSVVPKPPTKIKLLDLPPIYSPKVSPQPKVFTAPPGWSRLPLSALLELTMEELETRRAVLLARAAYNKELGEWSKADLEEKMRKLESLKERFVVQRKNLKIQLENEKNEKSTSG